MLMPLLLVGMLVFFFWSTRSQQKKQDALVASLKKGDRVVSQSGLVGRLVELEPKYVKVEIAPGVKVQMLRTSLIGRDSDDASDKKEKAEPASEKKA
ncbi:MAG TPA: preprotein translocase subunit YajC [Polyangiaceae bacterium]|nr:preprotein translocase subunit YajC [Polyangiaceae bacterium]